MAYGSPMPVTFQVGSSIWQRAEATNVPADTETTILSYTVADASFFLDHLRMRGEFAAVFNVYLNGALKESHTINVAKPVADVQFSGTRLALNDVIAVKVTHKKTGSLFAFEASLVAHRGA